VPSTEQTRALHLETVFQPVIELGSNDCVAYEALTRFPADASLTTRERFLAAREQGAGAALELRAIAAALTHLDEIPPTAALAINVSPDVAVLEEFVELVAPFAHRLIVELTEHEPVDDYEFLTSVLDKLRALGARIAVDDVGAGFAGLQRLLTLRPEIIKLDRGIVGTIETDPSRRALTRALAGFADELGIALVAEGIERWSQSMSLCELGVSLGQGFLLGPPEGASA